MRCRHCAGQQQKASGANAAPVQQEEAAGWPRILPPGTTHLIFASGIKRCSPNQTTVDGGECLLLRLMEGAEVKHEVTGEHEDFGVIVNSVARVSQENPDGRGLWKRT